jgi:hypothetical protein
MPREDYKNVYSLTGPQLRFLEGLSVSLKFTRKQMYYSMSEILGYEVTDIHALKIAEASKIIAEFKRRVENN